MTVPTLEQMRAMDGAVIKNWRECAGNTARVMGGQGPELTEIGGASVSRMRLLPEDDFLNVASLTETGQAAALDRIGEYFEAGGVRGYLWIPDWVLTAEFGEALHAAGFALKAPCAALWTRPGEVAAGPDADIRAVETPEDLADFAKANAAGWGVSDEEYPVMEAAVASAPIRDNWRLFCAYVDGAPAAAAIVAFYGEYAYLADACTDPRFRRRGLQKALIAARARTAVAEGAEHLFVVTEFGDQSFWNQRAMGLSLAYGLTEWRRVQRP